MFLFTNCFCFCLLPGKRGHQIVAIRKESENPQSHRMKIKDLVPKSSIRKKEKKDLKLDGLNSECSSLKSIFVVRDNGKILSYNTNPRAGLMEIKVTRQGHCRIREYLKREGYVFTILLDLHIKSILHLYIEDSCRKMIHMKNLKIKCNKKEIKKSVEGHVFFSFLFFSTLFSFTDSRPGVSSS